MRDRGSPRTTDRRVVATGIDALCAHGRDWELTFHQIASGTPAFGEVGRFATEGRRVHRAALLDGAGSLLAELAGSVGRALAQAGLTAAERADCPLLLAAHSNETTEQGPLSSALAARTGLAGTERIYTTACVAASTAVADAAARIAAGQLERIVVAAGYLVEPVQFALFDAGRALSRDGRMRPFSRDRQGVLLGDGVAAVVLEAAAGAGPVAGGRWPRSRAGGGRGTRTTWYAPIRAAPGWPGRSRPRWTAPPWHPPRWAM